MARPFHIKHVSILFVEQLKAYMICTFRDMSHLLLRVYQGQTNYQTAVFEGVRASMHVLKSQTNRFKRNMVFGEILKRGELESSIYHLKLSVQNGDVSYSNMIDHTCTCMQQQAKVAHTMHRYFCLCFSFLILYILMKNLNK